MEALLSNEFVVLAFDALLHMTSVLVLGVIVLLSCKLLSKGFVDTKILTGLTIAVLLVIVRIFLLNNIHHVLGGMEVIIIMGAIGFVLFLTCFVLVYKLVAIPVLGSILSSIAIVAAQLTLAEYTPVLSLKLMPEGQRFAEYAGVANDRTKLLMEQAEAFRNQGGGIQKIIQQALASLAFFTSDDEQENLSRDFASGIAVYKERKAYMDSLSEEELAAYRVAMGQFLEEQGLAGAESRYSLSNLKNARPEDLENLANFMQDMNKEYGFTEDLPVLDDSDELPPSSDSLKQIANNLRGMNLSSEKNEELIGILSNLFDEEEFEAGMAEARAQLNDLRANSGELIGNFSGADLDSIRMKLETASGIKSGLRGINLNPDMPSYPKYTELPERDEPLVFPANSSFPNLGAFSNSSRKSRDQELLSIVVFQETGYYPSSGPSGTDPVDNPMQGGAMTPDLSSRIAGLSSSPSSDMYASTSTAAAARSNNSVQNVPQEGVSYYLPVAEFSAFPLPEIAEAPIDEPIIGPPTEPVEEDSSYFKKAELDAKLTNDYVLHIPTEENEAKLWSEVAQGVNIDAWFEGTSETNKGTIFIEGVAYRSGEKIKRERNGENYLFRFEGVLEGQIVITALKREAATAKE